MPLEDIQHEILSLANSGKLKDDVRTLTFNFKTLKWEVATEKISEIQVFELLPDLLTLFEK